MLPPGTFVDKVTHFLCSTRRSRFTIVETRAQHARRAPLAHPPQGNMDQGQAAPLPQQAAPPAQPAAAVQPLVLLAPPPPPLAPPAPPAFTLGPGCSHAILNFDDPNTGAMHTKLYNKAIAPLEAKFDGEVDNLAVFLASVRGDGASTGTGSSQCLSTTAPHGTSSPTMDRSLWTTPGHTRLHM